MNATTKTTMLLSLPIPNTAESDSPGHMAGKGARYGAVLGGALAVLAAGLAGSHTTLLLPGHHELSGLFDLALLGATVGVFNGGLAGALIGWGIPQDRG